MHTAIQTCMSLSTAPAGAPSELRAEISRLSARLAALEAAEPTMAAIKPDPDMDAEGTVLPVVQ